MNKIFRRIFNAARGTIVAVDETKSSHSQSNSKCDTITGGAHFAEFVKGTEYRREKL